MDGKYAEFANQMPLGLILLELKGIEFIDTAIPVDEQINLMSKHFYIAESNNYLARILDVKSSDEVLGHQFTDFIKISKQEKLKFFKDIILSGYKKTDFSLSDAHLYNGRRIFINGSCVCILDDDMLVRAWLIINDNTEKTLTQKALEESKEHYKMVTETVPNIIWSAKPDGTIEFYNNTTYNYTGYNYDFLKDEEGWIKLLHPDDLEHTKKIWKDSLKTGKKFEIEFRLKRYDGVYRWFISRAVPVKNGKVTKWIGICTDIEYRKKIEEKLKEKNEDLDNFVYMASHDLKQPISNIEGLVNTLPDLKDCDGDANFIIKMISDSIHKFRKNLMDMIEITKSQKETKASINKLSEVVDDVKSLLKVSIDETNAKIITDFNEVSEIEYSRKNLQSIIYNLLSNSIKYRSENRVPVIHIKTNIYDGYIILSVEDNGLGFKKQHISKVFSDFKRHHKNIEGTGVGLYLIKRIITNTGGKVKLESEEGKGSTFRVYFKY